MHVDLDVDLHKVFGTHQLGSPWLDPIEDLGLDPLSPSDEDGDDSDDVEDVQEEKEEVRHGQGVHNVEAEKNIDALLSHDLFDAPMSSLGWQQEYKSKLNRLQVFELRKRVNGSRLLDRVELVVTSPLLRTIQTAVGVFGNEGEIYGSDVDSVMAPKNEISTLNNYPPIVASELCRDRLMESEEDDMWYPEAREPYEEIAARGIQFLNRS
ncbi:hypothetical protein Q3G72_017682 [Acer saccharum]|nr:hypothetical protein Q3G72_017682 [Acer saccharum]